MELSKLLKKRRKELGLTLADIASRMGVSEATVQRWESGNIKSVRYDKISPLAEVLKVTPAAIMGWADEVSEQHFPAPRLATSTVSFPVLGEIAAGYDAVAIGLDTAVFHEAYRQTVAAVRR